MTALLGGDICFSSFLAETRSSQSLDAQLKDFALHSFPSVPSISVNDDEVCTGFAGHLCPTITGGFGPFTFSWTGPSGFVSSDSCINPTLAGTYTVSVTGGNNCVGEGSGTLTVNPQPVCNITGDDEICTGFTTDFCATAGMASYLWSGPEDNGATTQCINIGTAGEYTVIITDANGCADTCSRTLTVNPQPGSAITPPETTICEGTTATFCSNPSGGTPPYSYSWEGPAGFSSGNSCITVGDAGTYQIIITDANSCADTCEATLATEVCGQEFCSLTQGAYGNPGGMFNGMRRLQLIQSLLSQGPLVVGKPGRSLTINYDAAQCIIDRLPAVSGAKPLPSALGDATLSSSTCQTSPTPLPLQNGKFKNVLLGQTITLSLNVRLGCDLGTFQFCPEFDTREALIGPDSIPCTGDDIVNPDTLVFNQVFITPQSVLDALSNLGLPVSVSGLLELANRALAGQPTGGASLDDINMAVDNVNEAFDECSFVVYCGSIRPLKLGESGAGLPEVMSVEEPQGLIPTDFFLGQAYPNPFNGATTIDYGLPQDAHVNIDIFDILGRRVTTLVNEDQQAGYHQVTWNSGNAPSGVYFYRINAGEFVSAKKVLLMK